MNWEPIETAPKDGTMLLLCKARDADGNPITDNAWGIFIQVAAWWTPETGNQEGEWTVYCSMVREPRLHFEPSHWALVPTNPLLT